MNEPAPIFPNLGTNAVRDEVTLNGVDIEPAEVTQAPLDLAPKVTQVAPHNIRDDIARLRHRLPFVPVFPWPKASVLLNLGQNVSGDIRIPDQAVLMKISGQASFLMNEKGSADGKTSTQAMTVGNPSESADTLVGLETDWLYCANMREVSVRNPNAVAQFIGARFIFRDQI